jgi:hypothetical protein
MSSTKASVPDPNPFFHRGPIRDHAYFAGREHAVGQALSLLGNRQSISLVGQRRIGKTSLLFHIADPEVFTQHGLRRDQHLFVYVDCGGLSNLDQPGVYQVLLEEAGDTLSDIDPDLSRLAALDEAQSMTYRAFERALRGLIRGGWRPIILLDEFDLMAHNPHLDPDFFSGLRALAAKYSIAYVTASKRPLLDLTYADASTLSSPFFNIFASIRLGLFSEDASRQLLTRLAAKGGGSFTAATVDFLLDLAGPHPLFLQIAGFHAFELQQAAGSALSDADRLELHDSFCASAQEHFQYYWRNLTLEEQHTLYTLPNCQDSQPDVIRRLEQECLILRYAEGYDYLSSAFREFVSSQTVPGLLQAGPVAIDESQRRALLHGQSLDLTLTQYNLLLQLIKQAGQVMTIEELERAVWGDEYVEDPERIKSVIKGTRRALGEEAAWLENVRGVGYVWRSGGP